MSTIRVGNIGPLTGNTSVIADPGVSGGGMSLVSMGNQTLSGTTAATYTGIASWARRVTVVIDGASSSGTSALRLQFGTAGGFVTSGYTLVQTYSGTSGGGTTSSNGGGFEIYSDWGSAANTWMGAYQLYLINPSNNRWVCSAVLGNYYTSGGYSYNLTGYVTLSASLTQLRLTSQNGTDSFDNGTVNVFYE